MNIPPCGHAEAEPFSATLTGLTKWYPKFEDD